MDTMSGRGREGSPKGSICPIDTYSSAAERMAETISSVFFRFSSASSLSSLAGAATTASRRSGFRAAPKPAFSTLATICSGVTWLSS